jgi:hypothetical protein
MIHPRLLFGFYSARSIIHAPAKPRVSRAQFQTELSVRAVRSTAATYVAAQSEGIVNGIIYIIGLIVVVLAILSFLGLR